MERIILALSFSIGLSFTTHSSAQILSRYFVPVPIEEAHESIGSAQDHVLEPDSISVLVWNIKKTLEMPWEEEFKTYGKDKDLFLLQEVFEVDRFFNNLEYFTGFRWDFGKSFTYTRYQNRATGTMVGSKSDPTDVWVEHTEDTEPATGTPKSMTYAKYRIRAMRDEVLVITIHGINFTTLSSFKRQLDQSAEAIRKHSGPVIFAGDFNTRTKSRMAYMQSLLRSLGLRQVDFEDYNRCMTAVGSGHCLDHGFVRGLRIKSARVIGESRGSDHKPMVMSLAVSAFD